MAGKTRVSIAVENCSGCMRCALACSFFTSPEHLFSLSQSRISILPRFDQTGFEIVLHEDCDGCGICVPYCEFGALAREKVQS